ncbi:ribose-phosphate diphosphokinase [Methanosarcinaceae archaeon]|nr:ribose-phosphate diphosphokinase [Methanosarcinaceae archaeon]MBQ3620712.1 ribose-phosphate diphosphokinase [Methanosarcinaceae archaeon]
MLVIGGPASQLLASRVAAELGVSPVVSEFTRFPDNEQYLRIQADVDNEDVIIVQSTTTDSDFFALHQLLDACLTAASVTVVIPYMGYARQDKCFNKGEPISARAAAATIKADRVFTVNIHESTVLDHFPCRATDLDASPLIGRYIVSLNLERPLLVAPDHGVKEMVERVAGNLGLECEVFDKTRFSGDTVSIQKKEMDIKGRDVILIDDMVATGGTMVEAIKILRENGAKDVYVACVHPVLARNAVLRLYNAGVKDIMSTDTIEKIQSRISVASVIADAVRQ